MLEGDPALGAVSGLLWLVGAGHPRAPEFVPTVPSGPLDRISLHCLCAGRSWSSPWSPPPRLVGMLWSTT
jgi:hypothetical protein